MPSTLLSKIITPINLLVGVIFCIVLINSVSFVGKFLIVLFLILVNIMLGDLRIQMVFKSWYRFRYLLLSIFFVNIYFTYPEYQFAVDKLLLVMAMLALVNTYMQYESKTNIAKAIASLLYPIKFIGFNPQSAAVLFTATLNEVDNLKQDVKFKKPKLSVSLNSHMPLDDIANRLAMYIESLEKQDAEQT